MKHFLFFITPLLFCTTSAFYPTLTTSITPLTSLYATLGRSESIFNNIPFTSRPIANVSSHTTILPVEYIREHWNSAHMLSPPTGQMRALGIIGAEKNHHVPIGYNSLKSIAGSVRSAPFVPHLSTGAGGDRMLYTATLVDHNPVDYNSHKFISYSETSVDASKFVPRSLVSKGKVRESSRISCNGPADYNSHKSIPGSVRSAPIIPHSSTGAGGDRMSYATLSLGDRHSPVDYNSHKFISYSEASLDAAKFRSSSLINRGAPVRSRMYSSGPVDYNCQKTISRGSVRSAPFVPHSSTGAGGAAMSPASPSYRTYHPPEQR